jgi:hypothetical protein
MAIAFWFWVVIEFWAAFLDFLDLDFLDLWVFWIFRSRSRRANPPASRPPVAHCWGRWPTPKTRFP